MNGEWRVVKLGDIADLFDGPHATPCKTEEGPVFLGISNISCGRVDLNSIEHVSEEDYIKWTRRITPQKDDIVFSYETRLGEAAIVPDNLRCCLGRRMGLLRSKRELIEPRFLLYAYLGPEFQETLRSHTVPGSTVDRIPLIEMPNFPIRVPKLETQQKISSLLGSIDDKININQHINSTLETIVRTLFKSWFINFDPVHAKILDQCPIGMDESLLNMFPDEMEDSELGNIPKGWKIATASDVCQNIFSGGTPNTQTPTYWDGSIPWLSSGETRNKFIIKTEKKITQMGVDNSSTRLAKRGTTVIASAGQGKTRGQTSLLLLDCYINQSVVALRADSAKISDSYLYFDLERRYERFRQISDSQSSRGSLTTKLLGDELIIVPTKNIIEKFDEIAQPLVDKIALNLHESITLFDLRNLLLPKLLAGEINISEKEGGS